MKRVCKCAAVTGAVLLLGTAGANDVNCLAFGQVFIQSLVGLGLLLAGFRGATETRRHR